MLVSLKIRDFAIIDAAEVDLPIGFTVLTGETGAGKSILIDALMITLGGRCSADVVRNGAEAAEVEALFDISQQPVVRARLEQRDLVGDDPDTLLVRRVIGKKGRSKVVINGRLSTVATLGEVVRGLAEISGQHEQLSLLQTDRHLEILDGYGALLPLKLEYHAAYERWREKAQALSSLQQDEEATLRRIDFLRFQLDELTGVAPEPGEDERLRSERELLSHAEKLQRGARLGESLLYGEDGSAFDRVGKAVAEVGALAAIDSTLSASLAQLESARDTLADVARVLQRYADRVEVDPARLDAVEERLATLERLCRKYGGSLEDALAAQTALQAELETLENRDAHLATLQIETKQALGAALDLGKKLSVARRKAGKKFDRAVLTEAADMELAGAVFETRIESPEHCDGSALGPEGADIVEFFWSANPGEPVKPLAKIASGGELSRLMLAVKGVQSSRDLVSLYVFDEVDTGLGGSAADAIGRKIQAVAKDHQAITITHLAPIAARADHHLLVQKRVRNGRTTSYLTAVSGQERAEEIARMIDGASITKATRQAAKAMLERAQS